MPLITWQDMATQTAPKQAQLQVVPIVADHIPQVVRLCVQGMQDNPLHVRVFGADRTLRERRLRHFFTPLIRHIMRHGLLFGGYKNAQLIGVFGMFPPGQCRPRPQHAIHLLPVFRAGGTPLGLLRLVRWLWSWLHNDPAKPHWHLGPLVIAKHLQGRGMGRQLIAQVAIRVESSGELAWLETDKLSNVRLYESYGFSIVDQTTIMGVTNWFMQGRLPRISPAKPAD